MKTLKYTVTVVISGPEGEFDSVNADLSGKLQEDIWRHGKDLPKGLVLTRAEVCWNADL